MSVPFSLFMALRYFRPKRTFLSVVTVLSVLGVLLGVAVLVVVISVMEGFDEMWREKILGFNAHVTVLGPGPIEATPDFLGDIEKVEGVTGAAPFIQGLIFLNRGSEVVSPFLRGVDPARERRVSKVPDTVVEGDWRLGPGEILVGRQLARRAGLALGDTVTAYSPQSFARSDAIRLPEELTVSGVFDSGMYDIDNNFVICSLPTARDLFAMTDGVHGIQVMTADPEQAPRIAQRIAQRLGIAYDVRTWMEMNRQLFAVLRVEKNMMFFLLIFITIVAAFGITNTLITVTVQKTREIGLLQAVGFQPAGIMGIFLWQGGIAGVIGTVAGIGAGLLALRYRNDLLRFLNDRMGMQLLPAEFYQLSEIPARTSAHDLTWIAVSVMVICVIAGLIPAWRAARLDPARALRYE